MRYKKHTINCTYLKYMNGLFDICKHPQNYHYNQDNGCIHHAKSFFVFLCNLSFPLPPTSYLPESNNLLSVIINLFSFSRISYTWDYIVCIILPLASFSQHNYFEILLCCRAGVSKFLLFYPKELHSKYMKFGRPYMVSVVCSSLLATFKNVKGIHRLWNI